MDGGPGRADDGPMEVPARRLARLALLAALVTAGGVLGAACSPIPMLQEGPIVPKGKLRVAVGGSAFLPITADARFAPDGPTGKVDGSLQYIPLPHAVGWARYGLASWIELQATTSIPTFTMTVGAKFGLVGQRRFSHFSLAIAAEAGGSPILLQSTMGVTLVSSFQLSPTVAVDLSARFGTSAGLWQMPVLTPVASIAIGRSSQFRMGAGFAFDFRRFGLASTPGFFLMAGWETRAD